MASLKALCIDGLDFLLDLIKNDFVKKEEGKGLSSNDYTETEKQKLAGLENPTIKTVKVNNSALVPDQQKAVNIDLSNYATKADIANVYKWKGSKQTYDELPVSGQEIGDVYNIVTADPEHDILAGDNVAWDGSKWDKLGGTFTIDTSGFATKAQLNQKVDKESGKGLSTNDYTTEEKNKLAELKNYTHPINDGNKHVPANGTGNEGKFLKATAQAGVYVWDDVPAGTEVEAITTEEITQLYNQA